MAKKLKKIKKSDIEDFLPKVDALPKYDSKFKSIFEFIKNTDPEKEWEVIKDWLKQKPKTPIESLELLKEQPDVALRAKALHLVARKEHSRFELDWKDRTTILRGLARETLELEKKERGLKKQITKDMIEDWIIENYGDTWKEMNSRLQDMKNTLEILDHLSNQVTKRDADLRRFIEGGRKYVKNSGF